MKGRNMITTKEPIKIKEYTMTNHHGMSVTVSSIGAAITSILVPDRDGRINDVVLGFDESILYFYKWMSFGVVIGPCANRIDKAYFMLNNKRYHLDDNMNGCTLHSGKRSFQYRIWDSVCYEDEQGSHVVFSIESKHLDLGFPGNRKFSVTYTLTQDNCLELSYYAETDEDTVMNLTNHSYFNLDGHDAGSVLEHQLYIPSDKICETDERLVPTGKMLSVENTRFDFREKRKIGEIPGQTDTSGENCEGYDTNYEICEKNYLNTRDGIFTNLMLAAELESEKSGRAMRVYTDMPGMQLYTALALGDGVGGKSGARYTKNGAVCFETQYFPNAIHIPEFKQPVVKAGQEYNKRTVFEFYTI